MKIPTFAILITCTFCASIVHAADMSVLRAQVQLAKKRLACEKAASGETGITVKDIKFSIPTHVTAGAPGFLVSITFPDGNKRRFLVENIDPPQKGNSFPTVLPNGTRGFSVIGRKNGAWYAVNFSTQSGALSSDQNQVVNMEEKMLGQDLLVFSHSPHVAGIFKTNPSVSRMTMGIVLVRESFDESPNMIQEQIQLNVPALFSDERNNDFTFLPQWMDADRGVFVGWSKTEIYVWVLGALNVLSRNHQTISFAPQRKTRTGTVSLGTFVFDRKNMQPDTIKWEPNLDPETVHHRRPTFNPDGPVQ